MPTSYATGIIRTADRLEWTTLRGDRNGAAAVSAGRVAIPPADSSDEAAWGAAARAALQQARSQGARLQANLTVGLPTDQALLRVMRFPPAEADELSAMVGLQFDKISPFPPETMVVSHEVLDVRADGLLVLMAAARLETVEDWKRWLAAGGVRPRRVDVNLLARLRVLRDARALPREGRQVVVVLADDEAPAIAILQDGLPLALRGLGAPGVMDPSELGLELAREIGLTLLSLEMEFGAAPARGIALWHTGPPPEPVADSVARSCGCAVELHDLGTLPPLSEGLARRSMDGKPAPLDLTPATWREAEGEERFRRRLWNTAGATLLAWAMAVGGMAGWHGLEQRRLAAREAERAQWSIPATEVRDMRRRVALIRRYRDKSRSALECWRVITEHQPPGVDLTALTYRKGESIKLSGEAQDVNQVYDFKSRLDASGLFVSCTLQGPRLEPARGKQLFDIDMVLPRVQE